MTAPKTPIKYPEMEPFWDQVLTTENGLGITLESESAAIRRSQMLNMYRNSIRKRNASIYPPENPMHGASPWDNYKVTIDKENKCRVLIQEAKAEVVKVEAL